MVLNGSAGIAALWVPANMHLLPLPPYTPEFDPVEHLWDELRKKYFHNRVFDSLGAPEDHLVATVRTTEQMHDTIRSIVAWPWGIDALTK